MALVSIRSLLAQHNLASPQEFEAWSKAWRLAVEAGSAESLLSFMAREQGSAEDVFLQELAKALGWPFIEIAKMDVPPEARKKISTKVAFQYSVLPAKFENGRLLVAVSNPFDAAMLNAVQFDARDPVQFRPGHQERAGEGAQEVLRRRAPKPWTKWPGTTSRWSCWWRTRKSRKATRKPASSNLSTRSSGRPSRTAPPTSISSRRRTNCASATALTASCIRRPMPAQLKRYQASLISRIKVMSGMNIAEKRLPQDGRINVRIKGEEIDIRVSTVPTVYGESVSLRLLTRGKIFLSLEKLGFAKEEEDHIREIIVKPHGIFLVTGPTGSGKSTSLYAFLSTINSVTKRIITIEEPVEYELKGINQIAVRGDIGLTFAMGLRHILRQDPNVIMVGEIRDLETAEIAIRAALTGHLVFSTLHTNDAPSAFTRLIDMGIEPFLVASSVEAVLAQRLVRTICPKCKTVIPVQRDYLMSLGFPEEDIATTDFCKGRRLRGMPDAGLPGAHGHLRIALHG